MGQSSKFKKSFLSVILFAALSNTALYGTEPEEEQLRSSRRYLKSKVPDKHKKHEPYSDEDDTTILKFKNMIDRVDYIPPQSFEFSLNTNEIIYLVENIIKRIRFEPPYGELTAKMSTHYYNERLHGWLYKLEEDLLFRGSVNQRIQLLQVYELLEIKDKSKKIKLIKLIDDDSKPYSLEELVQIANYYYRSSDKDKAQKWFNILMGRPLCCVKEKLQMAQWYYEGNGVIQCNLRRSKALYVKVLMEHREHESECILWIERIKRRGE